MLYFSYNDFADYEESGKIKEIRKVEEKIAKYEVKNGEIQEYNQAEEIVKILRKKKKLGLFLKKYFNFSEIGNLENMIYCNQIESKMDKEKKNNIICKIENKEIFILIKVIGEIDRNIAYKMFDYSIKIINDWKQNSKEINRRNPIVVPIVIYIGNESWKEPNSKSYNNLKYITFEQNEINFSYNMLNIRKLDI